MKTALLIASILVCFALLAFGLRKHHETMRTSLPPVEKSTHAEVQALMLRGADMVGVLGTGSMVPYIPGNAPSEIVAYVEVERVPFDRLKAGDLIIYRAAGINIIHQLDRRYPEGWVGSGLHNASYDFRAFGYITAANYIARVTHTYIVQ
jgi:hypothetical protein